MIDKFLNLFTNKSKNPNLNNNSDSLKDIYTRLGLRNPDNYFPKSNNIFKLTDNNCDSVVLLQDNLDIISVIQVSNALKFHNIILVGFEYISEPFMHKIKKNISSGNIDQNLSDTLFVAKNNNSSLKTISINKQFTSDYNFFSGSIDYIMKNIDEKCIGIAISKSIFDGRNKIRKQKFRPAQTANDNELIDRIKNGKTDFNDMLQIFGMFEQLKNSPMASMLKGVNLADMEKPIKKFKAIIQSMTKKERKDFRIIKENSSRINRIAAGSKSTIEQVKKLIESLEQIRSNGHQIQNLMSNPSLFKDLMK